jgi:dienelactone hydrolase
MQEQTITFANRVGRRMVGTLLVPDGSEAVPGVLVVHGFRGNRHEHHITAIADALAWAGFITLRVDLTNNLGESEGSFRGLTVSSEVSDAQDALAWLAAHPRVDPSRIGITGHSLGGLVAVLAGAGVRAIVTLSAVYDMAPRLRAMLGDRFPDWAIKGEIEMDPPGCGVILGYQYYEDLVQQDIAGSLARLTAPIRIVHGEDDNGVPVGDARLFYEGAGSDQKDLVLLPGADHGYSRDTDLMKVCLYTADWFRRWL